MGPMMYNPLDTGTAVAGGKGGTMGGFGATPGAGKGGTTGAEVGTTPATTTAPPVTTPVAPVEPAAPAANVQGPNAFETGINAQNEAMNFYQNAMSGGAQNVMDMISKMSKGAGSIGMGGTGGGGGSYGPAYQAQGVARDLYDYDPAQVSSQGYSAAQLSDADLSQYMNPYTQDVIDATMADLDLARDNAMNASGVAATSGGAFGGDRHGIMEAQNNADYMRQVGEHLGQPPQPRLPERTERGDGRHKCHEPAAILQRSGADGGRDG